MHDVLIVGGGMVGATLACALRRAGTGRGALSVAVVEAGQRPDFAPPGQTADADYDLRVSAISPAARRLFERIGMWRRIRDTRISPFRAMRVWDAAGSGRLSLDAADVGLPELGHIVENRLIQAAAWEACAGDDGVDFLCERRVQTLQVDEAAVEASLSDGTRLRARLVVGADGAGSPTRRQLDIPTIEYGYTQRCMVGTMRPQKHHGDIAWQRFRAEGPVAFLPLTGGRVSLAWYESPERCLALLEACEDEFARELAAAADHALGEIAAVGRRASFPLRVMHAREYVRPRGALVGDAAHVIHPMAGQGVNLGLMDAAALAEVVSTAAVHGRDIGGYGTLRRYERWRKPDNLLMMGVVHGLKQLYEAPSPPLRVLRNGGMSLVDGLAPLKRLMMRQALGEHDDLPALVRR